MGNGDWRTVGIRFPIPESRFPNHGDRLAIHSKPRSQEEPMKKMRDRLALHTWTLDTTPLSDALRAAKSAGWNAVELRRIDFTRCFEQGMTNAQVLDLVRASGLEVACIGTEYGLIFAQGEERSRLLKALEETCANARALGCDLVMVAPGQNPPGTLREAAANFRAGGDIAKAHGARFALEFNSA